MEKKKGCIKESDRNLRDFISLNFNKNVSGLLKELRVYDLQYNVYPELPNTLENYELLQSLNDGEVFGTDTDFGYHVYILRDKVERALEVQEYTVSKTEE